jgi:hypothetical protein
MKQSKGKKVVEINLYDYDARIQQGMNTPDLTALVQTVLEDFRKEIGARGVIKPRRTPEEEKAKGNFKSVMPHTFIESGNELLQGFCLSRDCSILVLFRRMKEIAQTASRDPVNDPRKANLFVKNPKQPIQCYRLVWKQPPNAVDAFILVSGP